MFRSLTYLPTLLRLYLSNDIFELVIAYDLFLFCFMFLLSAVFKNLIHLTIMTHQNAGWESMPNLLKNCPNLDDLSF